MVSPDMTNVDRDHRYHPLWALGRDAAAAKDPDLARLGARLCERTLDWIMAQRRGEAADAPDFADAARLVLSRLTWSIIPGAACAGYIARDRHDGQCLLINLFGHARARARSLMLRYATDDDSDEASVQLVMRGLTDRVADVRAFATERVLTWRSQPLLEQMRQAMSREADHEVRAFMQQTESLVVRGYWLGDVDELGLRPFELAGGPEAHAGSIPAGVFDTLSESEVIERLRQAARDFRSEAGAWVESVNEDWRRTRGFPDLTPAHPPTRRPIRNNPQ